MRERCSARKRWRHQATDGDREWMDQSARTRYAHRRPANKDGGHRARVRARRGRKGWCPNAVEENGEIESRAARGARKQRESHLAKNPRKKSSGHRGRSGHSTERELPSNPEKAGGACVNRKKQTREWLRLAGR